MSRRFQPLVIVGIDRGPFRLGVRTPRTADLRPFLPVQAQPVQVFQQRRDVFGTAALPVGILDPQQKLAAPAPGQEGVEQCSADVAQVQIAGRAGCEARFDDFSGHRQGMVTESIRARQIWRRALLLVIMLSSFHHQATPYDA